MEFQLAFHLMAAPPGFDPGGGARIAVVKDALEGVRQNARRKRRPPFWTYGRHPRVRQHQGKAGPLPNWPHMAVRCGFG